MSIYVGAAFLGFVIIESIAVSGGRPLGRWSDAVTKENAIFPVCQDVWYSHVYFVVAIAIMLALNVMAVRRLELLNIELVE